MGKDTVEVYWIETKGKSLEKISKTVYKDNIRFIYRPSNETFYKEMKMCFKNIFRSLLTAKAIFFFIFFVFMFGVFEKYLDQKKVLL